MPCVCWYIVHNVQVAEVLCLSKRESIWLLEIYCISFSQLLSDPREQAHPRRCNCLKLTLLSMVVVVVNFNWLKERVPVSSPAPPWWEWCPVRSPRKWTANPRINSIIPQAVFQRLSCPTGGLNWVRRRQRLIASIYSSSDDIFTLFSITTKQNIALKPCETFYKQRWLSYCPTLVISSDLGLLESSW